MKEKSKAAMELGLQGRACALKLIEETNLRHRAGARARRNVGTRKGKSKMRGNGYVYQRGNVFWCSFYLNGKEQRNESTKETDPKKAEKYLKDRLDAAGAARRADRKCSATGKMNRVTIHDLFRSTESRLHPTRQGDGGTNACPSLPCADRAKNSG